MTMEKRFYETPSSEAFDVSLEENFVDTVPPIVEDPGTDPEEGGWS